jgi:hypothetical protein
MKLFRKTSEKEFSLRVINGEEIGCHPARDVRYSSLNKMADIVTSKQAVEKEM